MPFSIEQRAIQQNLVKTCLYQLSKWNENPLCQVLPSATVSCHHPPLFQNQYSKGLKQYLDANGPKQFARFVKEFPLPLFCDTTLRDGHQQIGYLLFSSLCCLDFQSLLATRLRTYDILNAAGIYSGHLPGLFSLEMWGGATFDVALRFLHEDPWDRVRRLRQAIPNIPFQMLLRGTNAVGYSKYPGNKEAEEILLNVLIEFCKEAVKSGVDIFRVFDALNDFDNLQRGIDVRSAKGGGRKKEATKNIDHAVGYSGGVIEGAIAYTTDANRKNISDSLRYTNDYFLFVAEQLVKSDVHIIAIKDMAGLLTPYTVTQLITSIRNEYPKIPLHLHMHDTAGTAVATYLAAAYNECLERLRMLLIIVSVNAGADIVDVATDSLSGLTSQPAMGAMLACLLEENHHSSIGLNESRLLSRYFREVRTYYAEYDCGPIISSSDPDVYNHQIPGGQLSNLHVQSRSLGNNWNDVVTAYSIANSILNDPIKVTPTSKAVGDFAQYLVPCNLLDEVKILQNVLKLDLPQSVLDYLKVRKLKFKPFKLQLSCEITIISGRNGKPPFGFPEPFRTQILSRLKLLSTENIILNNVDWGNVQLTLQTFMKEKSLQGFTSFDQTDLISYCLFPNVFLDFLEHTHKYGPYLTYLSTPIFFHGLPPGQSIVLTLSEGNIIHITRGIDEFANEFKINDRDLITFTFENPLGVYHEEGYNSNKETFHKNEQLHVLRSPLNGKIETIHIKSGDRIKLQAPLLTIQVKFSKFNLLLTSPWQGEVSRVLVQVRGTRLDEVKFSFWFVGRK